MLLSDRFSCSRYTREELRPQCLLGASLLIALIRTSFSADQTLTTFSCSTINRAYNSKLQQVQRLQSSQQDPFSCINVLCMEKASSCRRTHPVNTPAQLPLIAYLGQRGQRGPERGLCRRCLSGCERAACVRHADSCFHRMPGGSVGAQPSGTSTDARTVTRIPQNSYHRLQLCRMPGKS